MPIPLCPCPSVPTPSRASPVSVPTPRLRVPAFPASTLSDPRPPCHIRVPLSPLCPPLPLIAHSSRPPVSASPSPRPPPTPSSARSPPPPPAAIAPLSAARGAGGVVSALPEQPRGGGAAVSSSPSGARPQPAGPGRAGPGWRRGRRGRRGPRGAGPGAADSRRRAMYAKGKGSGVPSDGQAREKLALYVYEYLLHVGAQKSAQTFLSEIRWEKNITLGEPPGFLHSWWCVFWDLYCAAPDRRETCEHSSEAKAFHDYSAAAAPSPVMGNLPPGDGMAGGPVPPAFFQPFMSPRYPGGPRPPLRMPNQVRRSLPGPPLPKERGAAPPPPPGSTLTPYCPPSPQPPVGVPGSQPLLPNAMDPAARSQGHPGMGGPMQRMNPPRGMAGMGPQSYGSGMRPPPSSLAGPGMPTMNMGPGGRGPWPNPNANSIAYSSSSPGNYVGPPGGGGPPGTPILPSPGDSTNSSENMYTMMNPIGPAGNRPNVSDGMGDRNWGQGLGTGTGMRGGVPPTFLTPPFPFQFPMGPGPEGPMGGMSAMEPHHMNGSLGSGDMDGLPKSSPSNLGALSNPPGTPRDDAELSSNFLNPFQSDSKAAIFGSRWGWGDPKTR
uniref:Single stranded DNA binding protein 4 n=1 Tax=Corvus moneduloides TaxID=1196302 RepID=A0A8U7NIC0_CORMO